MFVCCCFFFVVVLFCLFVVFFSFFFSNHFEFNMFKKNMIVNGKEPHYKFSLEILIDFYFANFLLFLIIFQLIFFIMYTL